MYLQALQSIKIVIYLNVTNVHLQFMCQHHQLCQHIHHADHLHVELDGVHAKDLVANV